MSYATIRARIKSNLESVSGIGQVHDYRRLSTTWEEIYKRTVKDGRVNNWEISRLSLNEDVFGVQNLAGNEPFYHNRHMVQISGHLAVDDEKQTEKIFQDLVDAIEVVFRQDNTLGGICILPRQLQVPLIASKMFGGVFVHYCEMSFEAIERVTS